MKPIIFNAEMALAVQQGRKTQTRREVKFSTDMTDKEFYRMNEVLYVKNKGSVVLERRVVAAQPYKVGEVLWVREPAKIEGNFFNEKDGFKSYTKFKYKSDGIMDSIVVPSRFIKLVEGIGHFTQPKWMSMCQSILNGCIKEMARTFLRVTNVRVERLNEISDADILKEGISVKVDRGNKSYGDWQKVATTKLHASFRSLWESINGKGSFDNRWVWVIEFEVISKEEVESDNYEPKDK